MTDNPLPPGGTQQMFLYQQPELLTAEAHGELGVTPLDKPYAMAGSARAIPVTLAEFSSAQRNYPIVFTSLETPFPVAVTGIVEDDNLFVEDGTWDPACYVPAYLRCHPFAFAAEQEGRIAVCIDRAAASVKKNPKYPFFTDGKLAKETEQMMRFCAQYEAERKRTVEFCEELKSLGLLAAQRATHTPDDGSQEQTIANYVSIDAEKLAALDEAPLKALHASGRLALSYLQVYSLENWQALMVRRQERRVSQPSGS